MRSEQQYHYRPAELYEGVWSLSSVLVMHGYTDSDSIFQKQYNRGLETKLQHHATCTSPLLNVHAEWSIYGWSSTSSQYVIYGHEVHWVQAWCNYMYMAHNMRT